MHPTMKKKYFSTFILLFAFSILFAQMHDNVWLFGSAGGDQSSYDSTGVTLLDFSNGNKPEVFEKEPYTVNFYGTNTSMCDSSGNLLFYTNGEHVYSHNHKVMSNGNKIAAIINGLGYRLPQAAISLPFPQNEGKYVLITIEDDPNDTFGWKLFNHVIDMEKDNGLGQVIAKRQLLVQDSLSWGKISATKHANGRDWWFIVPRDFSNVYYIGLLTPDGIRIDTFENDEIVFDGLGQSAFSPDGTHFIRVDDKSLVTPNQISLFDFDRCTGKLSNYQSHFINEPNAFGLGCAFSKDSKLLYINNTITSYQYYLSEMDVFTSELTVAEWDGTLFKNTFPVNFYLSQLAPDGRIYINSTGSSVSMHVINFPGRSGNDCQFIQNGLQTPTQIRYEMPNFPNYRLGPLDGSSCDTLGLDNHPLARWRWEQEDTLQPLSITFTDLSDYEPDNWYWTFGDGQSSTAQYPVHAYDAKGVYTVCLVVSNANSADTLCRVLELGVSGTGAAERPGGISIIPNPANEYITIQSNQPQTGEMIIELTTATGQVAKRVTNSVSEGSSANVDIHTLPAGIYYCRVLVNGQAVHTGKLIIQH
jgi:hypothetical protein